MTPSDRFEHAFADLLEEVAVPSYPDYFDDVLERATARPQRPAWTFPERWIPMGVLAQRVAAAPSVPWRTLGLVALLALLVAAIAVAVGSQRRVPAPFGPAGNGVIAYARDGDIYTRATVDAPERLVVGGPEQAVAPFFSLDGTQLAWYELEGDPADRATLFVAASDGSGRRPLFGPDVVHWASWSPAGDRLAVIHGERARTLTLVPVQGEVAAQPVELGEITPWSGVEWRPPAGDDLIFQGVERSRYAIFAVDPNGGEPRRLTPLGGPNESGGGYSFSADGGTLVYTRVADNVRIHVVDIASATDREFGAALPPPAEGPDAALEHHGHPVISPDGAQVAFGRYWDERVGEINHQLWAGSIASDGADAVPLLPVHRSRSGHDPFWYTFAPDGSTLLVATNDTADAWLAAPSGGVEELDWGLLNDPPVWQRTLP